MGNNSFFNELNDVINSEIFQTWRDMSQEGIIICDKKNIIRYIDPICKKLFNIDSKYDNLPMNSLLGSKTYQTLIKEGTTAINHERHRLNLKYCQSEDVNMVIVNDITSVENIRKESEIVTQLNDELQTVYEQYGDETILIANNKGKVIFSGKALAENCGVDSSYMIGKNVYDLEADKIFYPSVTVEVLKTKEPAAVIQTIKKGSMFVAVGSPIFDSNGKLTKVVSVTRDFSKHIKMASLLSEIKKSNNKDKEPGEEAPDIIACDKKMLHVIGLAETVAKVDTTILITGDTGTGKEVLARNIYKMSKRVDKPFVKVNCGAISPTIIESELFGYESGSFTGAKKEGKIGLIEAANTGTLFLDEISELPLDQQVKLLEVLQERSFKRVGGTKSINIDIRVIAATNKNLAEQVKEGTFREDLFYRLNVIPINIPSLSERKDDVALLLTHFIKLFNQKYDKQVDLSKEAFDYLCNFPWPGNVRELENTIERIIITAFDGYVDVDELPEQIRFANAPENNITVNNITSLQDGLETVEKKLIQMALSEYKTEKKVAEVLGVNQSTISRKIKYYDLK